MNSLTNFYEIWQKKIEFTTTVSSHKFIEQQQPAREAFPKPVSHCKGKQTGQPLSLFGYSQQPGIPHKEKSEVHTGGEFYHHHRTPNLRKLAVSRHKKAGLQKSTAYHKHCINKSTDSQELATCN